MRLRNTTRGDLSAGDVTFPAGGTAEAPPEAAVKGDLVFAAWLEAGMLVPEDGALPRRGRRRKSQEAKP